MPELDEIYDRTPENLKRLLQYAIHNQISHKELADWCYAYYDDYACSIGTPSEGSYADDKGLEIAYEIDREWEAFLNHTYSFSERGTIDLSKVRMPEEWLRNWLKKLS